MGELTGATWSADIFEALGRHDIAANLRLGISVGPVPPHPRCVEASELMHAERLLSKLEQLLCGECKKAWRAAQ